MPVAYLAGEETALIAFLDGRPLRPTTAPPRPFERGLRRRPTLVQNPETLAHIALIDRHGPAWFRQVGTRDHPGSALVTVTGAVGLPGVQEIACGATLSSVLAAAGDALEPLRAVLVGGCHGVWIAGDELETVTLDDVALARHGGGLGAGVIVALGQSACPAQELAHAIGYLAEQSAGQCGPCSNGLPAIAELLAAAVAGRALPGAHRQLERWSRDLPGRGACHLPDGAVRVLRSGMRVFARELAAHERGPCRACGRRADAGAAVNPHLHIDPIACDGRGLCAELFPEWIALDDWGYPIVDHGPIPDQLLVHARRAVEACPKLALTLRDDDSLREPRKP